MVESGDLDTKEIPWSSFFVPNNSLSTFFSMRRNVLAVALGLFSISASAWAQSYSAFSACDLNLDGIVNSADADLAVSMILTPATCSANIVGLGLCNLVVVQRVVNAAIPGGTCVVGNSSSSQSVTLPIEVMNSDTQSVQVSVPSVPAGTTQLWMQIHGLEYETQASVQVNGGGWIPITTSNLTFYGLESSFGGLGGGFSTLAVTMNLSSGTVVLGTNTICWRFNGTNGISSGFRVLAVNFQSSGTNLISSSAFTQANPSTWLPPLNDPTDIAAGQTLWSTATLTDPVAGGSPVLSTATCGNCHAVDGRDLKYFNYSNTVIQARAMFHGLSATQAAQIASYIRSLNVPNPGLPWNPPYQPGAGLDSQPVTNWSAGAGLSAVLGSDAAMLPYVAPSGTPSDFSPAGHLNVRETPLAMQLADWNHWLPTIYPGDTFGSAFTSNAAFTDYGTIRNMLGTPPASASTYNNVAVNGPSWGADLSTFGTGLTPAATSSLWSNPATARQFYSLYQWRVAKMWEINQEWQLEGLSQAVFGAKAEPRAWFTNIPFETSPNINHIPPGSPGLLNGEVSAFEYVANSWYITEMVLNSNNQLGCNSPMDFGYTLGVLNTLVAQTNTPQAMLYLEVLTRGLQVSNNTGMNPSAPCGSGGVIPNDSDPDFLLNTPIIWSGLSSSQRSTLLTNYIVNWEAYISSFTPAMWYTNVTSPTEEVYAANPWADFASAVAYIIPHATYWGMSSTVANALEAWAASVWTSSPYNNGGTFSWPKTLTSVCSTGSSGVVTCSTD